MNQDEYKKLEQIEQKHWFYCGKRTIVRYWIKQYISLTKNDLLIDAGMGTGLWLVEMSSACSVLGLDSYEESLALAEPKIKSVGGNAIKTSLEKVELQSSIAKVITLLDVLEHIDDDRGAFQEMVRLTCPGGLLIVTVPALQYLYSDWDEVLHHHRRYSKDELLSVLSTPEVEILHCSYINVAALFPIALIRLWRKVFLSKPGSPRAEDQIPKEPINSLLYQIFVKTACWKWFPAPIGVSLLAVVKKKL